MLAFPVLPPVMLNQVFLQYILLKLNSDTLATGMGYSLSFDGDILEFPDAERAPPESYFSRGYES